MDHDTLATLRRTHPGWRLLASDHAPLVASFLHARFIGPNARALGRDELVARLDDHLHALRERLGEGAFPRSAAQYLEEWAADDKGWLRKYYPPGSDEPRYDLTPAAEKALEWLAGLEKRQFVATESRLLTVFELLRQMVQGTEVDPEARVAELERRRAEIDAEIARVRAGDVELMDAARVKDRFLQMAATARGLLSDFREVEQNFRELNRAVRERIATADAAKGALLAEVFGRRDAIADSDQGRSFRAFWDFLMSPARQDELTALLDAVLALEPVRALGPDPRLRRVHHDWLEAGDGAQRTVARLSEQLRRYLDDQAWLENRRVMQLIRGVEQHALHVRDAPPAEAFMHLDEPAPTVELAMERPLHTPPLRGTIAQRALQAGGADVPTDALFGRFHVDKARLEAHVRRALRGRAQVSLAELVEAQPITQGLAELVAYMALAAEDRRAVIDPDRHETVTWTDADGRTLRSTLPLVVFTR